MSEQAAPTSHQQAEDAELYRATLHRLLGLATNVAQALHDDITRTRPAYAPPPTPEELQALSLAFDRAARCIRRTVLLCRTLGEPPKTNPAKSREAARKRILREVEDAIEREAPPKSAPSLRAELRDRLDAPETEDDLGTRPIEDIIAEIARDLGVPIPDRVFRWKRRTPEDLAALGAIAKTPRPPADTPSAGVPPADHRSAGVPPADHRSAGVPPADHRSAGVPPADHRSAGVPPAPEPPPKSPGQHPAAP